MSYSDERLDQLLQLSGEQWRTSQPQLNSLNVATLVRERGQSRSINFVFGPVGSIGAVLFATVALVVLFVAGPLGSPQTVSPAPTSASPTTGGWPNTLYLENRGGPAFTVTINGVDVATVACGDYPTLMPDAENVPQLPWDLLITRNRDGTTILVQQVTDLPRWFVQIGNEPLGLSDNVVMGPPGPTCQPDTPRPSSSPLCSTDQETSSLAVIEAVNLDTLNFGGVYLDDNGVLVIQYVGANAGREAVERALPCALAVRWEKVDRSRAYLDRIQSEVLSRVQSGEEELRDVFSIALDTIGNQIVVRVGPADSVSDPSQLLAAAYGDAVRVELTADVPVVH